MYNSSSAGLTTIPEINEAIRISLASNDFLLLEMEFNRNKVKHFKEKIQEAISADIPNINGLYSRSIRSNISIQAFSATVNNIKDLATAMKAQQELARLEHQIFKAEALRDYEPDESIHETEIHHLFLTELKPYYMAMAFSKNTEKTIHAFAKKIQQLINIYKLDNPETPERDDRIREIIDLIHDGPIAVDQRLKQLRLYFPYKDTKSEPLTPSVLLKFLNISSIASDEKFRIQHISKEAIEKIKAKLKSLKDLDKIGDYVQFFCTCIDEFLKNCERNPHEIHTFSQPTLDILNLRLAQLASKDEIPAEARVAIRNIKQLLKWLTPQHSKNSSQNDNTAIPPTLKNTPK